MLSTSSASAWRSAESIFSGSPKASSAATARAGWRVVRHIYVFLLTINYALNLVGKRLAFRRVHFLWVAQSKLGGNRASWLARCPTYLRLPANDQLCSQPRRQAPGVPQSPFSLGRPKQARRQPRELVGALSDISTSSCQRSIMLSTSS